MNEAGQYLEFAKPFWAPPAYLFGPVWAVLYIIILISFGAVFYRAIKKELPFLVALPFLLNLLFNFLFTPIQFGLRNNLLALFDVILVSITLIWAMAVIYPKIKWIAFANIPYLLWVLFATALQASVTYLN